MPLRKKGNWFLDSRQPGPRAILHQTLAAEMKAGRQALRTSEPDANAVWAGKEKQSLLQQEMQKGATVVSGGVGKGRTVSPENHF